MRITKISVKGLFGMFDHEIPLNQESRITIVHGPNGVGKSVMMRMLNGITYNSVEEFESTPFDQFRVDYWGGSFICIEKTNTDYEEKWEDAKLTVTFKWSVDKEITSFEVKQQENEDLVPKRYGHYPINNNLEGIDTFRLTNYGYKPYLTVSDLDNTLVSASISKIEETMRTVFSDIEWLEDLYEMLDSGRDRPYSVLSHWLDKMGSRIKPMREFFLNLFEDLFEEDEAKRIINLLAMIDFFELINSRILYKEMEIHNGYIAFFNYKLGEYTNVPLSALSSGEQHLLVLYYRLLFETEPDSLVIIDEPEISMNVVWQRNFLKDLQRIVELRKFDVLIATHSPQIIHDKWDWVVHLGAKVDA